MFRISTFYTLFAFCVFCTVPVLSRAQIGFEEKTTAAGIDRTSESWGLSWGDLNGDGWPDCWLGNHFRPIRPNPVPPGYYINQGDGTFLWIEADSFQNDCHAAAWADYDRDGDMDLLSLTGRGGGNMLFNNADGVMTDVTDTATLFDHSGRGRTPLWLDANGDGLLDLVLTYNEPFAPDQPYATYYENQGGDKFKNRNNATNFIIDDASTVATLADMDGDNQTEMLMIVGKKRVFMYKYDPLPFADSILYEAVEITDLVPGDFNGDLKTDLLIIRGERMADAIQQNDSTIIAYLSPKNSEHSLYISSEDSIEIDVDFEVNFPFPVRLGSAGTESDTLHFVLDGSDTTFFGLSNYTAGTDTGLYIGYDTTLMSWSINFSFPGPSKGVALVLNAYGTLTLDSVAGFESPPVYLESKLLFSGTDSLLDTTSWSGLSGPWSPIAAVAADFDNDGDLDVYMACASGIPNLPNKLFENQGDGSFNVVPLAGGAEGSELGLAEAVATVDYDRDGFVDLMVTNGKGDFYQGPVQLFRNLGNSNHWIVLEPVGKDSNPHGIGATALISAGGHLQHIENRGGMHRYAQNHPFMHAGLGTADRIDSLLVYWPSGRFQRIYEMEADRYTKIGEPPSWCKPPSMRNQSTTADSAFLSWEKRDSATAYRLIWKVQDGGLLHRLELSDTLVELSDLTPEESYIWSLQSVCGQDSSRHAVWRSFQTKSQVLASPDLVAGDLKLYPNPATEQLFLELPIEQQGVCTATIRDLNGLTRRSYASLKANEQRYKLALKDLPPAIYTVEMKCGTRQYSGQFVVSH